MKRRDPHEPLRPEDARVDGVDADGTLWVDGNRDLRSAPASKAYRQNYDLIRWPKRKDCA